MTALDLLMHMLFSCMQERNGGNEIIKQEMIFVQNREVTISLLNTEGFYWCTALPQAKMSLCKWGISTHLQWMSHVHFVAARILRMFSASNPNLAKSRVCNYLLRTRIP